MRLCFKHILFAAAVLPYVGIQCWVILQQPTWHALSTPIRLRSGTIRSPLFVTKATTDYRIMIEFDRKIYFDRMECLLGLAFGDALKKCNEIPEVLDLKWSVTTNDHVVASGVPMRGGSYSDTISRILGSFEANKGFAYRVNLTFLRDGSELDIANPRLVVETFPSYWEGPVILLQLAFFLALLGCGIAAFSSFPAAIRFLKRRRNSGLN